MANAIPSNDLLSNRATSMRTLFNSGWTLKLFKNNFTPDYTSGVSAFTEADFNGYAGVSLAGDWTAVHKIQDGEYQFESGTHTFTFGTGSSQTVYGWYITDGSIVGFSQKFSSAIVMDTGVSFSLQIRPQDWDKNL